MAVEPDAALDREFVEIPDCKAATKDAYGYRWVCEFKWGHHGLHGAFIPWWSDLKENVRQFVEWDDAGVRWR